MSKWSIYGYICIVIADISGMSSILIYESMTTYPLLTLSSAYLMILLFIISIILFYMSSRSSYIEIGSVRFNYSEALKKEITRELIMQKQNHISIKKLI